MNALGTATFFKETSITGGLGIHTQQALPREGQEPWWGSSQARDSGVGRMCPKLSCSPSPRIRLIKRDLMSHISLSLPL